MKTDNSHIYLGVDVGASRTKVALLDADRKLVGWSVAISGTDFDATALSCRDRALQASEIGRDRITAGVSTGYGRYNVAYVNRTRTEIACHARGAYRAFPMAAIVVDIGGQDNKVIKLDEGGRRIDFKMNRKCAAGTGAFLEEMSLRLNVPLADMNELAQRSENMVELGSYCTVFSATEVLEKIRQGRKLPDIVKGLFASVVKRILEMDALDGTVVMTGGVVAYNPYLATMLADKIDREVFVPEHPQLTGAIGAALFAMDDHLKNSGQD